MDNWLGAGRIKPRIIFRFVTIGLLSMGFLFYRFFYKEYSTDCYNDAWHDFTAELNHHLDQNGADNVVIGIGQVFMDFWIIAISAFWYLNQHAGSPSSKMQEFLSLPLSSSSAGSFS